MVAFVSKQMWKYDFLTSAWVLESGANPMSVTAGTTLIGFQSNWHNSDTPVTLPADSAGTFVDFTNATVFHKPLQMRLFHQDNATGGNHTVTPFAGLTPTNDDGLIEIFEVSGLPSSQTQTSGNNQYAASSAHSWNINTANGTPQIGDLALAFTAYENSVATNPTDLTNPSGWTQLRVRQDAANNLPSQWCWRIVPSTGVLNAAWSETLDTNVTDNFSVIATMTPSPNATILLGQVMM